MILTVTRSSASEIPPGAKIALEDQDDGTAIIDINNDEVLAVMKNCSGEFFTLNKHTGIRLTGFVQVTELDFVKWTIEAG